MRVNLVKLKNNSIEELQDDVSEIHYLSRTFLSRTVIEPDEPINHVKISLQESHDYLMQILSRFLNMICKNIERK